MDTKSCLATESPLEEVYEGTSWTYDTLACER